MTLSICATNITQRNKSSQCYADACAVLPAGVNSPIRAFKEAHIDPLVIKHAHQDLLTDLDDNTYIDYCNSWGALIYGHAHPHIVQSVCEQMQKGSSYGLLAPLEVLLAKQILKHVPADKLRFVSSGTEATMTALRLARGYTGKHKIIKFDGHYHGHVDALLIKAGSGCLSLNGVASSAGVPPEFASLTLSVPFNDEPAMLTALDQPDVAAVIIEPIAANMGVVIPHEGFLQKLRDLTAKRGILLIFDEVITGFRLGLKGASGFFGIEPDILTFGKIIGGGLPVAAIAGKKQIMDYLAPLGPVYQAGTLSGNPVAMAAGYAALQLLEEPGFYSSLEEKTQIITHPLQELIKKKNLSACINQVGSMFTLFLGQKQVDNLQQLRACDANWYRQLFHYLLQKGIYCSPLQCEANFVSMAHTLDHLEYTRDALLAFFA